jgi:hypothetical protein
MEYPGVVLAREVQHYGPVWAVLALQFGAVLYQAKRRTVPPRRVPIVRPSSDATWFVPVHLWGIASIFHGGWLLFGDGPHGCFGLSPLAFGDHALFSFAVLGAVIPLCFLAEHLARRVGFPVRMPQATLPVALLAAILGVCGSWAVMFLALVPLP